MLENPQATKDALIQWIRDYFGKNGPNCSAVVGISGGKDSMLMAKLLQELKRHGKIHFELVFLVMNPGYNADNWKIIQDNAKVLGIPLTVFESNIFDTVSFSTKRPSIIRRKERYPPSILYASYPASSSIFTV